MSEMPLAPLLWFGAVVALIPLALWLLRRSPVGTSMAAAGMRTVGQLPLSASQRIVTVEVGSGEERTWLVLGITPQQIRTLHTMRPQPGAAAAAPGAGTGFAQMLGRLRDGGGQAHGR
ncbi:MAG: flagellar biosynthetic protein FliO [Burkholderiales bacterium]|nr:flagellar biosynthetic protein FliO [Burkholderiales bacterium]